VPAPDLTSAKPIELRPNGTSCTSDLHRVHG
jgi:hypothetical protein